VARVVVLSLCLLIGRVSVSQPIKSLSDDDESCASIA